MSGDIYKQIDVIFEDLMVGHNFEYASDAIKKLMNDRESEYEECRRITCYRAIQTRHTKEKTRRRHTMNDKPFITYPNRQDVEAAQLADYPYMNDEQKIDIILNKISDSLKFENIDIDVREVAKKDIQQLLEGYILNKKLDRGTR